MFEVDPMNVHCTEGKVLVEITEVLGGMKGQIWRPAEDHGGKDTASGRVLQVGPRPSLWHKPRRDGSGHDVLPGTQTWPPDYVPVQVGDQVVFPRDVPKAWSWEDKRYAIVLLHELIGRSNQDDFEVLPHPGTP